MSRPTAEERARAKAQLREIVKLQAVAHKQYEDAKRKLREYEQHMRSLDEQVEALRRRGL